MPMNDSSRAFVSEGVMPLHKPADRRETLGLQSVLVPVAAGLLLSIFLIDLRMPIGVAISQLYAVPVLLGLWARSPKVPLMIASVGTALSLIDLPLSPAGGNLWLGAISRPLSWLIIWATAILVFRHKQMAHKLREQEMLIRIGAMAAVLAHEVRNPLTGVQNGLEILARRMPADSDDRGAVRTMQARIDSLSEMMRDVLLFAQEQPIRWATVPIELLIESLVASLRTEFSELEVRLDLDKAAARIPGDAEQIQIALGNILRNAAQAVDGRGSLSVTTRTHDKVCAIHVRDDGPGVPLTIREHPFEPFVTTKSRGTGLGLAIARRIVEAHRGTIALQCPRDGGTLVTVTLPAGASQTS